MISLRTPVVLVRLSPAFAIELLVGCRAFSSWEGILRCFDGRVLLMFDVSRCVVRQGVGTFLCGSGVIVRQFQLEYAILYAVAAPLREKFMPN
jgi:hypothetical protein